MSHRRRVSSPLVLAGGLLSLSGCGAESNYLYADGSETNSSQISEELFANPTRFWSGDPVMIPVCWVNPTSASASARAQVRRAAEGEWNRYARINFTGWGGCDTAPSGRRVEITITTSGGSSCVHASGNAKVSCNFNTSCISTVGDTCYDATARHEFGHVLGYLHEEERTDYVESSYWSGATGPGCAKQDWCDDNDCSGHIRYGGYDPLSIMSYCQASLGVLSPNDVVAAQHTYGFRSQSVTSPGGNCVAVSSAGGLDSGAFQWDCDEAPGQKWKISSGSGAHRIEWSVNDPAYCLGLTSSANGTQLTGRPCNSLQTRWKFENTQIRGYGGKCLDLQGGNTANGTKVQTWTCLGNSNQRWSLTDSGEIRFGLLSSNKCLTVQNGATSNGTKLYIWTCNGGQAQRFTRVNGQFRYGGKCIDVPAASAAQYQPNGALGTEASPNVPGNGNQLQLWTCSEYVNKKWFISGPIESVHYPGKCMHLPSGSMANGTAVQGRDCDGSDDQVWDMYW